MNPSTTYTELDFPASNHAAAAGGRIERVSQSLRRLERWVPWAMSAYIAMLVTFSLPGMYSLWVFALFAGLIGLWAQAQPARQSKMMARALSLVAGAFALHLHTATVVASPGAPMLVWLAIPCLYYTLLLKPKLAAIILGFALTGLALASLRVPAPSAVAEVLLQLGVFCGLPLLLAAKFGKGKREPGEVVPSDHADSSKALFNSGGFAAHGNDMLAASRAEKRSLSVAVFNCADLLEVRDIYGSRIARELTERIVDKLGAVSSGRGLAARTGPAEFSLVLPGMGSDKATAAIHRALGNPMRIEMDAGDTEIVLVPEFLVETAGPDVASVEELQQQLHDKLAQMAADKQRRLHYMQRERARHSRPMPVMSDELWSRRAVSASPTMPIPLGSRGAVGG
ncbi:MAG: hypothetical protein ABIR26_15145 [Ramlibacter sp.]